HLAGLPRMAVYPTVVRRMGRSDRRPHPLLEANPAPIRKPGAGSRLARRRSHVVSGPRGLIYLTATTALAWIADAACLHSARVGSGARVSPEVLLFAYPAGTLPPMAPLLPAGLGVVETVTPAV